MMMIMVTHAASVTAELLVLSRISNLSATFQAMLGILFGSFPVSHNSVRLFFCDDIGHKGPQAHKETQDTAKDFFFFRRK